MGDRSSIPRRCVLFPSLWPNQSPDLIGRSVKLSTYLHSVSRLRIYGALPRSFHASILGTGMVSPYFIKKHCVIQCRTKANCLTKNSEVKGDLFYSIKYVFQWKDLEKLRKILLAMVSSPANI
jgi:lipid-A-disaccharide synthase-like uncharacterized protein